MSYILDALRKSSEERQKRQERDHHLLEPLPPAEIQSREKSKGVLFSLLIITLVLVFAVLTGAWWYIGTPSQSPVEKMSSSSSEQPQMKRITPRPPAVLPEATQPSPLLVEQPAPLSAPLPKRQIATETIPLLEDLPLTAQAAIPEMKFSGHVYSPTPVLRMIMINTSIVREGDMITPEVRLQEITENGLLMTFKTTIFRIDLF